TGQQAMMMWTPGDRLHRRQMFGVRLQGSVRGHVPNEDAVIVAARGQMLIVRRPLEATHFLSVALQLTFWHHTGRSDIALQDVPITRARAEDVTVPSERSNASIVTFEHFHHLICC